MASNSSLANVCPYCQGPMQPVQMGCAACEVKVEGRFAASPLSNLPTEHQRFIEMFVLASGSLKEIAAHAGVSYPTVRSRLNRVIEVLRQELTQPVDDDPGEDRKSNGPGAAEIIKRI